MRSRDPKNVVVVDVSYDLPARNDHVRDRETGRAVLVVGVLDRTPAANYAINGDYTVADANNDYDPRAPVIACLFIDALDGYKEADVDEAHPNYFPVDRLRLNAAVEGGEAA